MCSTGHYDIFALQEFAFDTDREAMALQLFQLRICSKIAGSYQVEPWTRVVLQLIRFDASVRHASIALASIYQSSEMTSTSPPSLDTFGLQQYDSAIRQHIACIRHYDGPVDILGSCIVACILFICIEVLQFHYQSACSLIHQVLQLLHKLLLRDGGVSVWPLKVFERFACRLQGQAMSIIDSDMFYGMTPPRVKRSPIPEVPQNFESVTQARECFELYRVWYDKTHWRNEPLSTSQNERDQIDQSYDAIMSRYSCSLNTFQEHAGKGLHDEDCRALALLKIRQRIWLTWQTIRSTHVGSSVEQHQDCWDTCEDTVEEVLEMSETAMGISTGQQYSSEARSTPDLNFTLDIGVISPLSDVARLCRDPVLRRRAIQLLRLWSHREGLADSLWSARVCERVMELEEASATGKVMSAADVPPSARIRRVVVDFDHSNSRALMSYFRRESPNPQLEHMSIR